MIFENIEKASNFDEVQNILLNTHTLLGGRNRPTQKELTSTLSLILSQMLVRPTFEVDFGVLLQKIAPYLQKKNQIQRGDMAKTLFNTTAACAPEKYAFVVNSWQAAAAPTFVPEAQESLIELVDRGMDVSKVVDFTNQLSQHRPQLWSEIKKTVFGGENQHNNRLPFLVQSGQLCRGNIVEVFMLASTNAHQSIQLLSVEDRNIVQTLIKQHQISLEDFLDNMKKKSIEAPHIHHPSLKEFIKKINQLQDPSISVAKFSSTEIIVFHNIIRVFGVEYSPKYTAALLQFKQNYSEKNPPLLDMQQWFEQMPYEAAVCESRNAKFESAKKKMM